MAHAQSSPRGLFAKARVDVGASQITADSTGLVFSAGLKVSNKANGVVTGDSTGLVLVGGIKVSSAQLITADSTGLIISGTSALPGNVDGGVQFTLVSNSTGVALAVNSTGTTWKYLSTTSVQPT